MDSRRRVNSDVMSLTTRTNLMTCPSCGKTGDPESNFCEHCAFPLTRTRETVASTIKRHKKTIAILALMIGLLVVMGYFAWHAANPAKSTLTSQFDLTTEKVSALARDQMEKDVEARMPKGVTSLGYFGTYEDMRRAKILDCTVSVWGRYLDCKPGPNGERFKLDGSDLTLLIGHKIPSVTGVSRVDDTSALADVVLVFEPSKGYEVFQRWEQAFHKPPIQPEKHTVHLRRFADGWRIEKVD
jgi:hypothetical protein